MNIKKLTIVFQRLGFKKHSPLVYQSIREFGPLLATDIARSAKIHRPALYRSLKELLNAKLISTKKIGRRTKYMAESIHRLTSLFMEGLEDISKLTKNKKASEVEVINSATRIFHGPNGIRAVFDEVIDHTPRGHTFYRYTSEKDLAAVNRYLSPDYRERRDKKRLERLVISNPISGKLKRSRLERFIKFIPPETNLFDQNIIQIIYEDRVAFIDLNTEQVIVIESSSLADFQKVIFKQLYRKL